MAVLMTRAFGVNPEPSGALPSTTLQAALRRRVSDRLALNLWFTSALGAGMALLTGLALIWVTLMLWRGFIASVLANGGPIYSLSGLLGEAVAFLQPNALTLYVLAHHVPLTVHFAAGTSGASGNGTLSPPLLGLLVVPALALTLGGYLSATSDYTRVARYSIARGALIAPWYAVLLLLLSLVGTSAISGGAVGVRGAVTVGAAPLAAFFFGLVWGALFGGFGGWIHLSGRHWLARALPALQATRRPLPGAALAGALVTLVSGVLSFLAIGGAAVALLNVQSASETASPTLATTALRIQALGGLSFLLELLLLLGPAAAFWIFALATGADLSAAQTATKLDGGNASTSLGLLGAQHALSPGTWLLLALVPILCALAGGRVAARIARAGTVREGFVAGARLAVPLSVLAALLAAATSADVTLRLAGTTAHASAGPSVGGVFLTTLLLGGVVGGLGGASVLTAPALGDAPRALLAPLRPLGRPLFSQLDQLTGRAPDEPLTAARAWFYDGMLATAILGALALAADVITILSARAAPNRLLIGMDQWLGAALIGVPLLLFVGALVVAFSSPPSVPPIVGAPASVTAFTLPLATPPVSFPVPSAPRSPLPPIVGAPASVTAFTLPLATPPVSFPVPSAPRSPLPPPEDGTVSPETPA
jgi:hypothetical protein